MNYKIDTLTTQSKALFDIYNRFEYVPNEITFIEDFLNLFSKEGKNKYRYKKKIDDLKIIYKTHILAIESPELAKNIT